MLPTEELRKVLSVQRRKLFERVARAEDDLRWLDEHVAPERTEEAQEETIARLLARLDDRGRVEIEAIDTALGRIARGVYGRCDSCSKAIPVERLRAVPTTARCIACAKSAGSSAKS
jgi:RNA polymerase-binding protein DksA